MGKNTRLSPAGYATTTLPGGQVFEADTLQCVHCQAIWQIKPGSGNVRGYCLKCNGPVCSERCAKHCVPSEQLLENIEQGRPADFRPVILGYSRPVR